MSIFKKIKVNITDSENKTHSEEVITTEGEEKVTVEKACSLVLEPLTQHVEKLTMKEDEWIWIEGYKGTDKDMKCRDFQFTLGEEYSLPENDEPVLCAHGFHLCISLSRVFSYYNIIENNRFFRAKALVRKSEYEKLTSSTNYWVIPSLTNDKLVAKSIILTEELTIDEILESTAIADYPLEYKQKALEIGTAKAQELYFKDRLADCGYNKELVKYIMSIKKYELAYAIGQQEELTMHEKLSLILK